MITAVMSSARGLRLLKSLETYCKRFPNNYDSSMVLNKLNIISMSQGCTKGLFTVDSSMCNAGGTLHGGYIASMVDVLSFFSILSDGNGRVSWTTNLNVDFLKAATIGAKVNVETTLQKNRNTSTLETKFFDESGATLARGTASFQSGNEKWQNMLKKELDFDVYEN